MGKVKTIDVEKEALKAKEKEQKEQERLERIAAEKAHAQVKEEPVVESEASATSDESQSTEKKSKKSISKYAAKKGKKRERSKNYQKAAAQIDKSKHYSLKDALSLLEKTHLAKFDETVELHINTTQSGLSGQVMLPHGTGKSVRVAIVAPSKDAKAADDLLKEIEAGKINFDILIATPDAMPKLAKVAKVLGPKGLMPNPKAGTITPNPDAVAKQYAGGQMHYKTEAKMPILHAAVGKLSFGAEKLAENVQSFLKAVKMENIKKVTIKSTMSP